MTVIFTKVEAEITDDLISKFSREFDFDAMLRKVCEDAGVIIEEMLVVVENDSTNPDVQIEQEKKKYKLKGLWLAMEKAYRHLVTTLALYGTRLVDSVPGSIDVKDSDFSKLLAHPLFHEGQNEGVGAIASKIMLEDSKNIKKRRPRKSALQSRKLICSITKEDEEDVDEQCDSNLKAEDGSAEETKKLSSSLDLNNSKGKENDSKYSEEDVATDDKVGEVKVLKTDSTNKLAGGRRGRPKVYDDDGISEFPCTHCSYVAKKRYKLQSHIREIHFSNPSTCTVCNKVFPNKRTMLKHKVCHGGPQHCCDICGKMYKIKKAMQNHRKTHDSSYTKPSFQCDECPKSFCNQYVLDNHVRDIHRGLKKSYLCSVCGKSFTSKHSLTEHSNAHNGIKPYECEICGKTFSYESALRDHKFCHTENKQFWCKHCQKGFSQRSGLKMHMRTHKLHKMFVCEECGRGFTQKQALQRHERVHKGEKPFICKHCGKYFTDSSIVRRHLILVHKIEKTAKVWREDIICTIVADKEHHVQKISEEDKLLTIEKEKEEVLRNVGVQNKNDSKKKPTRSFQRVYPRKGVIVDEEDNIIAPSEVSALTTPMSDVIAMKTDSTQNTTLQIKVITPQNVLNAPLMETSDGVELDSQILNQRFIDQNQWDALAGQLQKAGAHLEPIILEDPNQSEASSRNQDQVLNLQKIIKCENVQAVVTVDPNPQQTEPQPMQSLRYSPVSFTPLSLSNNSKSQENQFEPLNAQLANSNGQYYDIRGSSHSAVPWSSVYYYSHLASQLGINISSDLSYINSASSSSGTSMASCAMQNSMDMHQVSATSLVIQKQPQEIDSDSSPHSQQHTTSHHANVIPSSSFVDATNISCVQNIPALMESIPVHGQKVVDTEDSTIVQSTDITNATSSIL